MRKRVGLEYGVKAEAFWVKKTLRREPQATFRSKHKSLFTNLKVTKRIRSFLKLIIDAHGRVRFDAGHVEKKRRYLVTFIMRI